ncbi:flagellar type III secretion system pore protein FliP [Aquabacterium sp. A7-Y]|uniref:flagellar type III secretion system pore protein FliP n=1 Tax=Aquabacterium sp. A7-Y TaxID=1349605 RepID=UPI00223CAB95|nr:flagellar type III secretion system pore protein FliP [Aquabacterium sp. A7-Y]MCW7540864.1 flagellar type III secretion system pore protein FliP [Aquabacterium sp. A7-Y]
MSRPSSLLAALLLMLAPAAAWGAEAPPASLGALLDGGKQAAGLTSYARTLVGLSLLSLIPAALIAMTSFTRIVVTLSFLRHAMGMPETPPNVVLVTLAMFLTFFTMGPVFEQVHRNGLTPFLEGSAGTQQAIDGGLAPLKEFMHAHVRPEDLHAVAELAKKPLPESRAEVPMQVLVPAFMLSELRAAFTAGFIIFLPFLLIDLIVAAVLMALGMMMVPPVSVSLPLKVLLFVLIDGWTLLLRAIAGAYA